MRAKKETLRCLLQVQGLNVDETAIGMTWTILVLEQLQDIAIKVILKLYLKYILCNKYAYFKIFRKVFSFINILSTRRVSDVFDVQVCNEPRILRNEPISED